MRARDRAGRALRRTWHRGADYGWALREIGRGIAFPRLPPRFAHGDLAPVLLLPGVLENWTMMRRIAERLNALGHPVHALPELRRNTVSVPQASALAEAYLERFDLRSTVLVAHSKGGLIGKHLLLGDARGRVEDRTRDRIDRLVAVATPFAGSSLARLVPHPAMRAFRPDDAVILALDAHPEVNGRITSIYPRFDPHIPSGSHLAGAVNIPVETAGHFRVLGDPAVIEAVAAAVG